MAIDDLLILTEYEAEHAITAIEWVARAGKPIAEIGGRILETEEIEKLATDLNHCLDIARQPGV